MKKVIIIVWLCMLGSCAFSQMKVFEKVYNQGNLPYACFQRGDRYVVGAIINNGDSFWMFKTDLEGNLVSSKTYINLPGSDFMTKVIATQDGGFLLMGKTFDYPMYESIFYGYVIKVDSNLEKEWEYVHIDTTYQSLDCSNSFINGVQTDDGGYVLLGYTYRNASTNGLGSDFMLVKIDSSGNMEWEKIHSVWGFSSINAGMVMTDDGFLIASGQGFLFNINGSLTGSNLPYLMKTDFNGDTLWTKYFINPNVGLNSHQFEDLISLDNGEFLAIGAVNLRLKGDGEILSESYDWRGRYANLLTNGNIIVVGGNKVAKMDTDGTVIWLKEHFTEPEYGYANHYYFKDIIETSDGGFFGVVQYTGYMLLIKMDCEGNYKSVGCFSTGIEAGSGGVMMLSGNPVSDVLRLRVGYGGVYRVEIGDVLGRVHYSGVHSGGEVSLGAEGLIPGVYWIGVYGEEGDLMYSQKVLVIKN